MTVHVMEKNFCNYVQIMKKKIEWKNRKNLLSYKK